MEETALALEERASKTRNSSESSRLLREAASEWELLGCKNNDDSPGKKVVFLRRGMDLYQKLDKNEDALRVATEVVKLLPDEYQHYANRARILCRLSRYEDELKDRDRSIELNDETYIAYSLRAACLRNLGRLKDARRDIDRAFRMTHNKCDGFMFLTRAHICFDEQDYAGCIQDLEESLSLGLRKTINSTLIYALALQKQKQFQKAHAEYNWFISNYFAAFECGIALYNRAVIEELNMEHAIESGNLEMAAECKYKVLMDLKLVEIGGTQKPPFALNFPTPTQEEVKQLTLCVTQKFETASRAPAPVPKVLKKELKKEEQKVKKEEKKVKKEDRSRSRSRERVIEHPHSNSSSHEVGEWIASLGRAYKKYAKPFEANHVTGKFLIGFQQDDDKTCLQCLEDGGVDNPLHRRRIMAAIRTLKFSAR
jgi:tetratricopeptide (TPR) repeat protein